MMENLYNYLQECGEIATPANTMGMGDVSLPNGETFGTDGVPVKKRRKKKKIDESIFDDKDLWMDRVGEEVNVIKWLAEHMDVKMEYRETVSTLNKYLKFNSDGSFDMPDSSVFGETSYVFVLDEELPNYIKFNNIANKYNIFEIKCGGDFKTTGFPKSFLTDKKDLGNLSIDAHSKKIKNLILEKGTCSNIDLLIINTNADEVWMDRDAAIISAFLNCYLARVKKYPTTFNQIPVNLSFLKMSKNAVEYTMKANQIISHSTQLSGVS